MPCCCCHPLEGAAAQGLGFEGIRAERKIAKFPGRPCRAAQKRAVDDQPRPIPVPRAMKAR